MVHLIFRQKKKNAPTMPTYTLKIIFSINGLYKRFYVGILLPKSLCFLCLLYLYSCDF